jgi:replicative DNA helicase
MSMGVEEIVSAIREGKLDPAQAVEAFESPAKHIREIQIGHDIEVMPSGFPSLDRFQLLKKGQCELIILGARPSMGKSALMFQLAAYVSIRSNVLIFSLEMNSESIRRRFTASYVGRSIKALKGVAPAAIAAANRHLDSLNLYIDDRAGLDVNTIRSAALALHKKRPLSLIVVDYLGLVRSPRELGNKNNEIGEVTSGLKALAKQVGCPVLVGSQLNRECEKRGKDARSGSHGDYRPILSDLRDSGHIEQDADMIVFLSRHEFYEEGERPGEADIRIAKNRNGEVGDMVLKFIGAQTKFFDPEESDL